MNFKKLALPLFVTAFVFVGFGDRVLPSPLSTFSFTTRTALNQFLLGLSPNFKQQNPNEKMEKAVDGLAR
jgi:hypothetical protein